MKCKLCKREAKENYCTFHKQAYYNIVQNFEAWKKADPLSWKEYLKELVKNSYTGSWTKEVAEHLLKKDV
jgi:hypothetical protein